MARLNAVYRVITGQQRIAVLLRYSIPGKFRNGVETVVLGLLLNDRTCDFTNIVSRTEVVRMRKPGRINEMSVLQTHLHSCLIHQVRESRFTPGNMLGKGDCRIISGLDDQPQQQVLDPDAITRFDKHPGSYCFPCPLADSDLFIQPKDAPLDLLKYHVSCHQLTQTCGLNPFVFILRGNDCSRSRIHEQPG